VIDPDILKRQRQAVTALENGWSLAEQGLPHDLDVLPRSPELEEDPPLDPVEFAWQGTGMRTT
jgi:hypothetical protein